MQVDALAIRLRPRVPLEAADLGVRLCQSRARDVFACYGCVALPVLTAALLAHEIASWLPSVLIWWAKPWLDRTVLFVLSRGAFGQSTTPGDVWRAQRQVWWRHLPFTWTVQRLSPWRSLTQPVYQLEGMPLRRARARVRQIRRGRTGQAMLLTTAFVTAETSLTLALISLLFWFAPAGQAPTLADVFAGELSEVFSVAGAIAYALAVAFVEPFYVAAGFGMYLSRRADLEAWDLEQEFRRAFGR